MKSKKPTAGLILAAGMSRRLGKPKQLIKIDGRTLVETIVDAALGSRLDNVLLVLGYQFETVYQTLGPRIENPRLEIIENNDFEKGMSQSILSGLKRVGSICSSVMFLLGDQPLIDSPSIDFLLDRFYASPKDILVPVDGAKRGNPTLFGRVFFDQLLKIKGDMGAREIIRNHPEAVYFLKTKNPAYYFDIDTPADVEQLHSSIYSGGNPSE